MGLTCMLEKVLEWHIPGLAHFLSLTAPCGSCCNPLACKEDRHTWLVLYSHVSNRLQIKNKHTLQTMRTTKIFGIARLRTLSIVWYSKKMDSRAFRKLNPFPFSCEWDTHSAESLRNSKSGHLSPSQSNFWNIVFFSLRISKMDKSENLVIPIIIYHYQNPLEPRRIYW